MTTTTTNIIRYRPWWWWWRWWWWWGGGGGGCLHDEMKNRQRWETHRNINKHHEVGTSTNRKKTQPETPPPFLPPRCFFYRAKGHSSASAHPSPSSAYWSSIRSSVWIIRFFLHPGRITWNLKITQLKRKIIFQTIIFRFHVNLPGCKRLIVVQSCFGNFEASSNGKLKKNTAMFLSKNMAASSIAILG